MVSRYSLSALGADRPGIVAAVSGALVDVGCNLEDSTMTILRGHFAILLVVAAPPGVRTEDLERALAGVANDFDLTLAVRPLSDTGDGPEKDDALGSPSSMEAWTVSVHGADRPGIVHEVASALADAGGNVVDLSTHLVGEPSQPVYVMTIRAVLPEGPAGEAAAERVRQAGVAVGVHCTVHRDEAGLL